MPVNDSFHIYDTTLRDGAQQEGLNLSVHDKMNIARHLDDLGVGFIEGGWPGANPKDTEFFALAKKELKLKKELASSFIICTSCDFVIFILFEFFINLCI